ncbi:MAG: class I SAM-dependent methyltransferase [Balneolales bacterium]|nr:class I SAM-dependent methyltransferase [Balneolales bacterium]
MKILTRSAFYKKRIEPVLSRTSWFEYLLLKHKSPLAEWGWFESRRKNASLGAGGKAVPWYTYTFLDAFSDRIPADITVFEFGSGMSTRWWAERVKQVVSVEHHQGWYEQIRQELPPNAEIRLRNLGDGSYVRCVSEDAGTLYDIIIIDGRERVACAYECLARLSHRGVIIFDNSERERYAPALEFLKENEFRQLRFTGFIPQDFMGSETSVFYRDGNCLGI